jgi:methylenetetrahydrofolate reductase (NADPH)
MAMRRDESSLVPKQGGNDFAVDLLNKLCQLNYRKYLHDVMDVDKPILYLLGCRIPEKHLESILFRFERLKEK